MSHRAMTSIVLAVLAGTSWAEPQYGMEEHFGRAIPVPRSIIAQLRPALDPTREAASCGPILDALIEATPIALSSGVHVLLVKPSSVCLCAAWSCPFWLFRKHAGRFEQIGRVDAASLEVTGKLSHAIDSWLHTPGLQAGATKRYGPLMEGATCVSGTR
jgi:hypothetical protein